MSKYTLSIYEWAVGTIGQEYPTLTQIKQQASSLVFPSNFSFYTPDTGIREIFKTKFVNKFLYEEMGLETPALFRDRLYTRLQIIMPYYTQLYNSKVTELSDLVTSSSDNTTRHYSGDNKRDWNDSGESSGTSESSSSSQNATDATSQNTTSNSGNTNTQSLRSDEPQSTITSNAYASLLDRSEDVTSSSGTDNTTDHSQSSASAKGSTSDSSKNASTHAETGSNSGQETVSKSFTTTDKIKMLTAYRDFIFNIDSMILSDLEDLFMEVF